MNQITSSVNSFLTENQFENNFDGYGNIVLAVSASFDNQTYIAMSLMQYEYDASVIESLYDTTIAAATIENKQEIFAVNQNLQNSYESAIAENVALKESLNNLVASVDASPIPAEALAQKDLIINLRIQLGQGKVPADFSPQFPYQAL